MFSFVLATSNFSSECYGIWSPGHNQISMTHSRWWIFIKSLGWFKDLRGCMASPICMRWFFWSSFISFGAIFAQTFCISKFSMRLFQMVSQFWPNICHQSNSQTAIPMHHLHDVLNVDFIPNCWDIPLLSLSSTSSLPSLKLLNHSKTRECDIVSSP